MAVLLRREDLGCNVVQELLSQLAELCDIAGSQLVGDGHLPCTPCLSISLRPPGVLGKPRGRDAPREAHLLKQRRGVCLIQSSLCVHPDECSHELIEGPATGSAHPLGHDAEVFGRDQVPKVRGHLQPLRMKIMGPPAWQNGPREEALVLLVNLSNSTECDTQRLTLTDIA